MDAKYKICEGEDVIVVGTSERGIGGAIVKGFLNEGVCVHAIDRSKKNLDELHTPSEDSNLKRYVADVRDRKNYKNAIDEIGENNNPIKAFVYVAGIGAETSLDSFDEEIVDIIIDTNNKGLVLGTMYALPYLKKLDLHKTESLSRDYYELLGHKHGIDNLKLEEEMIRLVREQEKEMRKGSSITAISSVNAFRPEIGMSVYDASKAFIKTFVETASAELGPQGIRVNSVAPGEIITPQTIEELKNSETVKTFIDASSLKRIGLPEDIAAEVLYLTYGNTFVTGRCSEVSGGLGQKLYQKIPKQKNR